MNMLIHAPTPQSPMDKMIPGNIQGLLEEHGVFPLVGTLLALPRLPLGRQ